MVLKKPVPGAGKKGDANDQGISSFQSGCCPGSPCLQYEPEFSLEAIEGTIPAKLTAEVVELTGKLKELEAKPCALEQRGKEKK